MYLLNRIWLDIAIYYRCMLSFECVDLYSMPVNLKMAKGPSQEMRLPEC